MSSESMKRKLRRLLEELDAKANDPEHMPLNERIAMKTLKLARVHFDPTLPAPDTEAGRKWIKEHAGSEAEFQADMERRIAERIAKQTKRRR